MSTNRRKPKEDPTQKLQEVQEYLDIIIKMSHDGIVVINSDGCFESCNDAVTSIFGWSREDLVGEPFTKVISKDKRKEILGKWGKIQVGANCECEMVVFTKTGEKRTIYICCASLESEGKRKYPVVVKDITVGESTSAQHLQEMGTLAAMVAHEIRTPLGVIKAAAYNIKRKSGKEPVDGHAVNIEVKVDESNQIIENLLNYSKMKMPQLKNVALSGILRKCVTGCRSRYGSKDVRISTKLRTKGKDRVSVDPIQIGQVFNNVLDNACQALPGGRGTVCVSAERDEKNAVIVIVVEDTGCGIREEDLPNIFKPFFSRKAKGTGLGLAVSQRIIELHGGVIKVESRASEGTSVRIDLPIV